MVLAISADQLTSASRGLSKTKYFPIELFCSNMLPNTNYDVFYDGIQVNEFCKPFGGNLGDALTSSSDGKLTTIFFLSVQYNQQYLSGTNSMDKLIKSKKVIEFRSPQGVSSITYLPMLIKSG
jgi:hypothetical protein